MYSFNFFLFWRTDRATTKTSFFTERSPTFDFRKKKEELYVNEGLPRNFGISAFITGRDSTAARLAGIRMC